MALGCAPDLLGFVFLWSFLDKAFALGFSTGRNPDTGVIDFFGPDAWINGGSPTDGAILFGAEGSVRRPVREPRRVGMGRVGVHAQHAADRHGADPGCGDPARRDRRDHLDGVFYTLTAIWPEHNPFVDEHVVRTIALVVIAMMGAAGTWVWESWERTALVKRFPVLK